MHVHVDIISRLFVLPANQTNPSNKIKQIWYHCNGLCLDRCVPMRNNDKTKQRLDGVTDSQPSRVSSNRKVNVSDCSRWEGLSECSCKIICSIDFETSTTIFWHSSLFGCRFVIDFFSEIFCFFLENLYEKAMFVGMRVSLRRRDRPLFRSSTNTAPRSSRLQSMKWRMHQPATKIISWIEAC